jgi:hydroxyacylglutathione hydrolase
MGMARFRPDSRDEKMTQEIRIITLPMPYKLGLVNCYLVKKDTGFFLVDTGFSNARLALEKELESAGCMPGQLKLILITHGDFDHTGNCAFLREKYGAKIAIHAEDAGLVESGDMFHNRKSGNPFIGKISNLIFYLKKADKFKPDIQLVESFDLQEYGFDAKTLALPGHSKGSMGFMISTGDLFCGDLLTNMGRPALNTLVDDREQIKASLLRLKALSIQTIFPGHGKPFTLADLVEGK